MTIYTSQLNALSTKRQALLVNWLNRYHQAGELSSSDARNRQTLMAYVVLKTSGDTTEESMQAYLNSKLPKHMVPQRIFILDSLPRLPNGKLDRKALPKSQKSRIIERPRLNEDLSDTQEVLKGIWAELLNLENPDLQDNFFEFGGDSIIAIQMISKAFDFGLRIEPRLVAEYPTIAGLSSVLEQEDIGEARRQSVEEDNVEVTSYGEAIATPIQQWFFSQNYTNPNYWNQSRLLQFDGQFEYSIIESAYKELFRQHPVLSSRFFTSDSGWIQSIPENTQHPALESFTTNSLSDEIFVGEVVKIQSSLNVSDGNLFRMIHVFTESNRKHYLLLIAHHLIVDNISWNILFSTLDENIEHLKSGKSISRTERSLPYIAWAQILNDFANSSQCLNSLTYWTDISPKCTGKIPSDFDEIEEITEASSSSYAIQLLEQNAVEEMQIVNSIYNTGNFEILLTALVLTLKSWTGNNSLVVDLEGHGREPIGDGDDVMQTVGWLTSFFPISFDLAEDISIGDALKIVKERVRNLPNNGLNFGALKYLSKNVNVVDQLNALPQSDVLLNYSGNTLANNANTNFVQMKHSAAADRDAQNQRSHPIELNIGIDNNTVGIEWIYSERLHSIKTIESLSNVYSDTLSKLVSHCKQKESKEYTPSEFPESDMNQEDLDSFLQSLE